MNPSAQPLHFLRSASQRTHARMHLKAESFRATPLPASADLRHCRTYHTTLPALSVSIFAGVRSGPGENKCGVVVPDRGGSSSSTGSFPLEHVLLLVSYYVNYSPLRASGWIDLGGVGWVRYDVPIGGEVTGRLD